MDVAEPGPPQATQQGAPRRLLSGLAGALGAVAAPGRPSQEGHAPLVESPDERLEGLVQSGQMRREALRQVTRENMDAEIREGLAETLRAGALPGFARAFCVVVLAGLLISLSLLCFVVVAVGFCMNFAGWFFTWYLVYCDHQLALRYWLFLFQVMAVAETCLRSHVLLWAVSSTVGTGITRCVVCSYAGLSATAKVLWCLHALRLASHAPLEKGCAESLPRFVGLYARVLLLQLLVVEPFVRIAMVAFQWAATSGLLPTTRGASPGTLESMEAFSYDADAFADPADPGDTRPQQECCVCLDDYDALRPIIRTPCRHLMHRECLAKWLQTSHFCPICRGDLEAGQHPEEP